ncbi:MAG: hypothetical protein M3552_09465 [Planctomycetota bacterium]|nr:hypothetical protein [Planctomycetaceae bacterium]MDQ3330867.1 hypothetical protein [Planctomycetota bacterium]
MNIASEPPRSLLSHRAKAILFTLAVVSAVGGGYAYQHHHRYKHIATHEPGMMYRSAWVEPDVMAELIEKHQIRAVVNLCAPGEMGEHRWALQRETVQNCGARLLELSMPNTIDPRDPGIAPHLAALSDPDNYPMLVHCQHGVTRTSKFLAIYDMCFRGKTAEESLAAQPLFGRDRHNVNVTAFCREFEKSREALYPQATASQLDVLRH